MSQQYLLPCSCGQKVRVSNAQAGGEVSCVCGKGLAVPTLRGLRQLEAAPVEASHKTELRWSPLHGAIFAAALLIGVAGAATAGYHLFYYAQLVGWFRPDRFDFTVDRSSEMIRGMSAEIDKETSALTPEDALAAFRKTESEGLGEKETLPWIALKKKADDHLIWIESGAAAFAIGLLVAIATLFIGRR